MSIAVYTTVIALFLLPGLLVAGYYLGLLAARLLGAHAHCPESSRHTHTFAVIIPAHNEERSLPDTLRSCSQLDYPDEQYEVIVVADNCSDKTAEVAASFGATCWERRNLHQPGKGQALEWAFDRVLKKSHDAVVVLDADCQIDSNALRVFDRCLEDGSRVLQANHVTSNQDAGPLSYVARVGQLLEYDYSYAPKSRLGLAVLLVGTGMVFHRDLLDEHPWKARSVVEDIEYTLMLARHGIRVRFVENVAVRHDSEEHIEQVTVQRRRWAGGAFALVRRSGLKLIWEGLTSRRLLVADAGWTLLTLSRPIVLAHAAAAVALAVAVSLLLPGNVSLGLLAIAGALALAQMAYFATGIVMVGLSFRRISFLLKAPLVIARLAVISLRSLVVPRHIHWERTPR